MAITEDKIRWVSTGALGAQYHAAIAPQQGDIGTHTLCGVLVDANEIKLAVEPYKCCQRCTQQLREP